MGDFNFEMGDLVWAKMTRHLWPGKIALPDGPIKAKNGQHFVDFFGTNIAGWILDRCILPHHDAIFQRYIGRTEFPEGLEEGIEEIKKESLKKPQNARKIMTPRASAENSQMASTSSNNPRARTGSKRPASNGGIRPSLRKRRRGSIQNLPDAARAILEQIEDDPLLSPVDNEEDDGASPFLRMLFGLKNDPQSFPENERQQNAPSCSNRLSNVAVIPPYKETSSASKQPKVILNRLVYPRPPTPVLDFSASSDVENVTPTDKKIGFLGLGMMGRGMVKNLLNSKHDVTVWNRTVERCDDFVEAGATRADTPFDVIKTCDITFCCVSDATASESLVFGNWGVMKALNESTPDTKCYVEMSSIDPSTVSKIAEAIKEGGGRFLEAPILGDRQLSEAGQLTIVCAGDEDVYEECETCFSALAKNSNFLGPNAGDAAKMNLVFSILSGGACSVMAEAMTMIEAFKLNASTFLEIIELGEISSPIMIQKGNQMLVNDYQTKTSVKNLQKDLAMVLQQGIKCQQPLIVVRACNDTFLRTKMLRYADHDTAAVLLGTRV